MRIQFVKEDGTYFAISQDQEWNGYLCKELIWAEIEKKGAWIVKWESDYSNPVICESLVAAKKYIEKEYYKFTPTNNGERYKL